MQMINHGRIIAGCLACLFILMPAQAQQSPLDNGVPFRSEPASAGRSVSNPYQGNEEAIQEGNRLYSWYNCGGCHAPQGGGGMGPPLSDDQWIYGSDPASVFESIWTGRPNGMPTWAGRIPTDEVWKIAAYLETLPGDTPAFAPQQVSP